MNTKLIIIDFQNDLIENMHYNDINKIIDNIISFINKSEGIEVFYTINKNGAEISNKFKNEIRNIVLRPSIDNIYIHNDISAYESFNKNKQQYTTLHENTGRWNIYICGISLNKNIEQTINDFLDVDAEVTILKNCIAYYDKNDTKNYFREFDKLGVNILHVNNN